MEDQVTKKTDTAFSDAYAALNKHQKEAVDSIDGPVMVIAGPGTGKTQILTLRIAQILLKTDTRPENILALTFTESGAKAMRERLHRYIGAAAFRVAIFTFHGFAEQLITQYPDAYAHIIGGRPASDLQKVALLETILDTSEIKLLRPMGNSSYYIPYIIRTLAELKKEYITPQDFAAIIELQEKELLGIERIHEKGAHKGKVRGEYIKKETAIKKNRELLYVYKQYEALLRTERLYDFEDMIVQTVAALESNEDMLRDLQETYHYVLADEHQDVNGSQNRILALLCSFHDRPNIFVVGDEKQAIYRFQGASLENFLYFEDAFPHTKTIALTENYRSGQQILDASFSLVAVDAGPLQALRIPLSAVKKEEATVVYREFSHQAVEDFSVVSEIAALLQEGVPHQEIAVIVRTNKEVEQFAGLLRKEGIAVDASADADILEHPIMHAIQDFIDAVVNPHDEKPLFSLLHGAYWGISSDDLIKIARARSFEHSLFSVLSSKEILHELGVDHVEAAYNIAVTLTEARARTVRESPHRVLEFMLQHSGFLDFVLTTDPIESARVVRRIYDEIEDLVLRNAAATLREVSAVFALCREHRIPLHAPYIAQHEHAVQVLTAHKSKGLEFEAVFIPHATDNVWGGPSKRTYFDIPQSKHVKADAFDESDDERRLLYVAMTRAKRILRICSSQMNSEGRPLIASRLIADISPEHMRTPNTSFEEQSFDPLSVVSSTLPHETLSSELLLLYLKEKGLSATALNNYLKSPWEYVYRNVLRVPEVQTPSLQFGTAIHAVMEWISSMYATMHTLPTPTAIKENLERQLSRLPITQTEFAALHEKGFEALLSYVAHTGSSMPTDSKVEFSVHVQLPTGLEGLPELTLTGKLDRLDFDAEGNVVLIVDYKTGKPKSRNEIEGNTKSSNGDYKRQLTFYALLLSLYDDPRYACTRGKLSFIEPDSRGNIHEEVFEITQQEIEALKAEIIDVAQQIITGAFLSDPCDDAVCNYCHLVRMLQQI